MLQLKEELLLETGEKAKRPQTASPLKVMVQQESTSNQTSPLKKITGVSPRKNKLKDPETSLNQELGDLLDHSIASLTQDSEFNFTSDVQLDQIFCLMDKRIKETREVMSTAAQA